MQVIDREMILPHLHNPFTFVARHVGHGRTYIKYMTATGVLSNISFYTIIKERGDTDADVDRVAESLIILLEAKYAER